jgi:E3 ubiquitin ligase
MHLALGALASDISTSADTKLEFWAAVGVFVGIVLFVRGFIMLRFKRLILNTPTSRVRSASMGLVEISGMAKGPTTIPSGITGEACYYYRAVAWELQQSGRNREWKQVASESLYVPFFVEDATGKMLVDPQGADLDLHRNFKDEFDTSFFSSRRDMLPENAAKFLMRNGIGYTNSIRLEEYCIKPDFPLFVLGTLGNNPHRERWDPVPHIGAGSTLNSRLSLFGFAGGGMFQSGMSLPGVTIALTSAALSANRTSSAAPKPVSSPAAAAPSSSWSTISMDDVSINRRPAPTTPPSSAQAAPRQFNQSSVAMPVATAEPDPVADNSPVNAPGDCGFDLHTPVCITKGPNKDPFMISWRSQRDVVRSLAWKSALCIWGGPALTLACLYFLAVTLGWT